MAVSAYAATDFAGTAGQKIERKLLLTYVNCSAFGENYSSTPTWQLVGKGVEDSSIEHNPSVTTTTDITGVTETSVDELQSSQSFEPMTVRVGSKLHFKLTDILERKAKSEFALFEVLIVRAYITETDSSATVYHAEKQTGCTVYPTSEGGSAYVDMPIQINFSNNSTLGTVASLSTPSFTPLSGT